MKVSLEYSEILQNLFVFTSDSFIFSWQNKWNWN
jgi:hypothetical protein